MEKITLSENLRSLMKANGLSTRKLSEKSGVPQSSISALLQDREPSGIKNILKLCDYFSVSLEFMMFGKQPAHKNLEELLTENLFEGFLKVKIEKVINKK